MGKVAGVTKPKGIDKLVDVPVVYMSFICVYICWLHSSYGVALLSWLARGGGLQSRLWSAAVTFVITMTTWHGYGAVQQWMDVRLHKYKQQQQ